VSVLEMAVPDANANDEYITLVQAAKIAGYKSPSTLQKAAREGRLRTIRAGPRVQVTTKAWLDAYLASIHEGMSHRGRPRAQDGTPEA
jgi:hypothetical protein